MEEQKVKVKFRLYKGEVIAVFPDHKFDHNSMVLCYAHDGQHVELCYRDIMRNSKPATKAQYDQLKREITSIGYIIKNT